LQIVKNGQFPAAQKLIGKNVGYKLNLPKYFFPGAGAALKKHHRAFRRTSLGPYTYQKQTDVIGMGSLSRSIG
jgi:hypothetical protein